MAKAASKKAKQARSKLENSGERGRKFVAGVDHAAKKAAQIEAKKAKLQQRKSAAGAAASVKMSVYGSKRRSGLLGG